MAHVPLEIRERLRVCPFPHLAPPSMLIHGRVLGADMFHLGAPYLPMIAGTPTPTRTAIQGGATERHTDLNYVYPAIALAGSPPQVSRPH